MAVQLSWLDRYFLPEATAPLANASTGTINNVSTVDLAGFPVSSIRFAGASPTVTGLDNGVDGRRIHVMATGGAVVLANDSASSTAANRITTGTGADVTVAAGSAAWLVYDATSSRWRLSSGSGGGGSVPTGTGFRKIVAGVEQAAAEPVDLADATERTGVLPLASQGSPTGTGLVKATAGAWDAATSLLANADVNAAAAIAITKLATGTAGQFFTVTAGPANTFGNTATYYGVGTGTLATVGGLRLDTTSQAIISGRNAANTNDISYLWCDASNNTYLGTEPTFTAAKQTPNLNMYAGTAVAIGLNGSTFIYCVSGNIEHWKPLTGSATASQPFQRGSAIITYASANITATAAQYSNPNLILAGTTAGARDLVLPSVTNGEFTIRNTTADIITAKKSAGTGIAIGAGKTAIVRYDATAADYVRVTADV